jgi:hypothetical protein
MVPDFRNMVALKDPSSHSCLLLVIHLGKKSDEVLVNN